MFNVEIVYESEPMNPEMEAVQNDILNGVSTADLAEKYDGFWLIDSAYVDLAVRLGWDYRSLLSKAGEYLNQFFCYDIEFPGGIRAELVNEAIEFITDIINSEAAEPVGCYRES